MSTHKNHLSKSYQLKTTDDIHNMYSDWAETYDAEIADNGYATPVRCAEALAQFAPSKGIAILDIGCGTGLSGQAMLALGFTQIDGCDTNPEMLNLAPDIYRERWVSEVNQPFAFEVGTYGAMTAVGVIGAGAAPLELLHLALEKLATGGLMVFSLNDHTLEDPSFEAAIHSYIDNGSFELLFKKYGDHLPGQNIKSNVYVMRRLNFV